MAGYTRQTTFVDAATIEAADHNNELNQVEIAFNNTTGHAHDGTVAEGPVIGVLGDAGITTPLNKVLVDTANNRLEFWIDVASSSTEQVYIADGVMAPTTDSDVDLGTNTERFKSLYVDDITVTDTEALKTSLGIQEAHARGVISNTGALQTGSIGVDSVASGGTGVLNITLTNAVTSVSTAVVIATSNETSFGGTFIEADMITTTNLRIKTYLSGSPPTAVNARVSFIVYDEA